MDEASDFAHSPTSINRVHINCNYLFFRIQEKDLKELRLASIFRSLVCVFLLMILHLSTLSYAHFYEDYRMKYNSLSLPFAIIYT